MSYLDQTREICKKAGIPLSEEEVTFLDGSLKAPTMTVVEAASTLYSSKLIAKSLEEHAAALVESAKASEKYSNALMESAQASERHAKGLTQATRVLALATIGLFLATVALVCVTYLAYHSTIIR
jgi:hypothetical protein